MTVNNSFKLRMINTWLTHIEYKKVKLFFFLNLRYHGNKKHDFTEKKSLKSN